VPPFRLVTLIPLFVVYILSFFFAFCPSLFRSCFFIAFFFFPSVITVFDLIRVMTVRECSKLEAVEVLPPATLLCATNSLVAQGQCLPLADIQKRCSEAQIELRFRFCVVMFRDGY
jgi:hypothetical protein